MTPERIRTAAAVAITGKSARALAGMKGRFRRSNGFDRAIAILNGYRLVDDCQPPPLQDGHTGHVYVIGQRAFVKIGWSEQVLRRLAQHQVSNPEELRVYALLSGRPELEGELHYRFRHLRYRNEWFKKERELNAWIKEGCPL